jgi:hypothetical protein
VITRAKSPLRVKIRLEINRLNAYELNHRSKEKMAEGVGFEPTKLSFAGFQDRCTRPLCEPSVGEITRSWPESKIG